jgi:hypothetical protein
MGFYVKQATKNGFFAVSRHFMHIIGQLVESILQKVFSKTQAQSTDGAASYKADG